MLGPLLFILFINDLPNCIDSTVKIFADDTKVFRAIGDMSDWVALQSDILNLTDWSNKWQLPFNVDKCKVVHYGRNNSNYTYDMDGMTLVSSVTEKDLGVIFDSELTFTHHVMEVVAKANSRLGMIRRYFTNLSERVVIPLYKSLVRPILEYCSCVWSPFLVYNIKEIEKVQRRATKMISGLQSLTYPERLRMLHLDSLAFRRRRSDMVQVFRIVKGFDNVDPARFFQFNRDTVTRGHNFKLIKVRVSSAKGLHSFSKRTVNDWNSLKSDTVNCTTINAFKKALKEEWFHHPQRFNEV